MPATLACPVAELPIAAGNRSWSLQSWRTFAFLFLVHVTPYLVQIVEKKHKVIVE